MHYNCPSDPEIRRFLPMGPHAGPGRRRRRVSKDVPDVRSRHECPSCSISRHARLRKPAQRLHTYLPPHSPQVQHASLRSIPKRSSRQSWKPIAPASTASSFRLAHIGSRRTVAPFILNSKIFQTLELTRSECSSSSPTRLAAASTFATAGTYAFPERRFATRLRRSLKPQSSPLIAAAHPTSFGSKKDTPPTSTI